VRSRALTLLSSLTVALAVTSCESPGYSQLAPAPAPAKSVPSGPVHAVLPTTPDSYLGVYEQGVPQSYKLVDQFANTIGRQPNVVLCYTSWGTGFQASFAQAALTHGATVLFDLDPTDVSVSSIANGSQDPYIRSYAEAVRAFGRPVIISFGHEMNGDWYSWGWTHTLPRTFRLAWRHIVAVFREVGADNATWLWTVNYTTFGESPIRAWWPGSAYVTWVGIDAYFDVPNDDFDTQFVPTINDIRGFTKRPILIGETAVGPLAGMAAKIPGLFAGVRQNHLLGFVWFDVAQNQGIYHQDWRLEGQPRAISAFRHAMKRYFARSN
jgi:Glycosyl hydrolase family 26